MRQRGWVVLVVVALFATPARAQSTDQLGIERFRIAIDRAGVLDVEWAGVPNHLAWGAGVTVGFAHDPLVVYDRDMNPIDALVGRRVTTSVVGSIALWNRLQLGATLDVVGYQSGSDVLGSMQDLPASGIGDARLLAKLFLVGDDRYQVALMPALTVPAGSAKGYLREAGATFSPAVAVSLRFGRARVAANFGYHVKPHVDAGGFVSDDEAFARLGGGVLVGAPHAPLAELWVATSLASPLADAESNQVAVEVLAGVARQFTATVDGFVGGGIGLDNGFGTPDWRALAGVRVSAPRESREPERTPVIVEAKPDPNRDGDGDGIPDVRDRCATQAEDKDGFQDDDGCVDELAKLDGRVIDVAGRPIAGAKVRVVLLDTPSAAPLELVADAEGRFTTQLAGGSVEVTAVAGEYKDAVVTMTVAPGSTSEAVVKMSRAVRQGQLRGQVLAFDGKPLAATITVTGKTTASAVTDADGQFTVELPAGAFTVEISSPGHVTQKRSVSIKLDGVTVLNVDMRSSK